ncbi:hypothetical protein V7S76_09830 [Aquirufa sp. ROCK2-A2]
MFDYEFYSQHIISEIEFPGIPTLEAPKFNLDSIHVSYGKTPEKLEIASNQEKPFSTFNENEFLYRIPNIANYYIRNGN